MMQPYVPDRPCPKCGGHDLGTSYHKSERDCRIYTDEAVHGEHIHRTCRTCGYNWPDAPLDHGRYDGDIKL